MPYPTIEPSSKSNALINEQLRNAIKLHLVKNSISLDIVKAPLYLAIQGPKGEGKTFQTIEACLQFEVIVFHISASLLSGSHEGEAIQILKDIYLEASLRRRSDSSRPCVIVIDDFHLSIAALYDGIEVTVNSQLLTGFMMNLAENPKICGEKATKIPVILIGNDFTKIHSPLTRHGRMNFFEWRPDLLSKTEIVESILKPILSCNDHKNISELVSQYFHQPIAFFSELKNDLVDKIITDYLSQSDFQLRNISEHIKETLYDITLSEIYPLAEKRNMLQLQAYEHIK